MKIFSKMSSESFPSVKWKFYKKSFNENFPKNFLMKIYQKKLNENFQSFKWKFTRKFFNKNFPKKKIWIKIFEPKKIN